MWTWMFSNFQFELNPQVTSLPKSDMCLFSFDAPGVLTLNLPGPTVPLHSPMKIASDQRNQISPNEPSIQLPSLPQSNSRYWINHNAFNFWSETEYINTTCSRSWIYSRGFDFLHFLHPRRLDCIIWKKRIISEEWTQDESCTIRAEKCRRDIYILCYLSIQHDGDQGLSVLAIFTGEFSIFELLYVRLYI